MIRRVASSRHSRREFVRERQDLLRGSALAPLPALSLKPLLERRDHHRGQAFPREARKFRSESVGAGILKIQALQNSTS